MDPVRTPAVGAKAPWFVAPSWVGADGGEALEILDFRSGATLDIDGAARRALLERRAATDPALQHMARFDPTLKRFLADLAERGMLPLDRATLLRGERYKQLYVELTAKCNEHCVHCYAESSPTRTEEQPWELVAQVLEDAAALGFHTVQLTGGDPLVSRLVVPAARRARELGIARVEIFTNGLALSGEVYEALRALGCAFAFSFYSHDPATHDGVTRTAGSQARTARAIARTLADGLEVRVECIVGPWNLDQGAATIGFLERLGLARDRIGVHRLASVGRGEACAWELPSEWQTPAYRGGPEVLFGSAAVSYQGDVFPCIFSRSFGLGNVREQRLREILEAPLPIAFDRDGLRAGFRKWADVLTCWECRLRASFLAPASSELIPLRVVRAP